jgi:hypothetical protein
MPAVEYYGETFVKIGDEISFWFPDSETILSQNNNKQFVYYCQTDVSDEESIGSKITLAVEEKELENQGVSSSCSDKVDKSSFYIGPYELNANSISFIKTFKPSEQLSLHYDHGPFNPSPLLIK